MDCLKGDGTVRSGASNANMSITGIAPPEEVANPLSLLWIRHTALYMPTQITTICWPGVTKRGSIIMRSDERARENTDMNSSYQAWNTWNASI